MTPSNEPYPVCVYSWGGLSRFHDYLMSDDTIRCLSEKEAEELLAKHLKQFENKDDREQKIQHR